MKSLVSIGFILTVIFLPDIAVVGYLTFLGDIGPIQAVTSVLSIPGELVLSLMT